MKLILGLMLVSFPYAATYVAAGQSPATGSTPVSTTAGQAAAVAPADSVDLNDVRTVRLDVIVTDKFGTPIKGLKAEDFTILDNKQRQTVSVQEAGISQAGDITVEAYILIDTINPPISTVASERHDLTAYLEAAGTLPIPTSLVFLTPDGLKIQGQSTREAESSAGQS